MKQIYFYFMFTWVSYICFFNHQNFKALQTSDLVPSSELKEPKKPDFIKNPHRYFGDRDSIKLSDLEKPTPSLAESILMTF
jgi:hypothetical protein